MTWRPGGKLYREFLPSAMGVAAGKEELRFPDAGAEQVPSLALRDGGLVGDSDCLALMSVAF